MKYEVIVGYTHFVFDDSEKALEFAEIAALHYQKHHNSDDDEIEVKILFKKEDKKDGKDKEKD